MLRQVLISTMHYANSSIIATSFDATTILEEAPSGKLPIMTETPPLVYTAVFGFLIALTTVFTTLLLVLYIYFRKEPEIRATTFTLSLYSCLQGAISTCFIYVFYFIATTHSIQLMYLATMLCVSVFNGYLGQVSH